jgi:phage tail sheath protein FI
MVAAPGETAKALQTQIVTHCQPPNDPYRIAILDGQETPKDPTSPTDINGGISSSDYAALYFPWIKVSDPADSSKTVSVGPSGHIAGIMARVDQQSGVFTSPANEIVRGALDLDYKLGKREQDGLNPAGINLIRSFRDGIKVWGARTLVGDNFGDTKYISIRRTLIFIEQSLDEGTQFVVFKPNTPALWQQVKRAVTAFLTNLWRDGGLFGTQPEQAFFVRVDETNNPPDLRQLGQLIIEVGVSIAYPAEFVIIRIQQYAQIPTAS